MLNLGGRGGPGGAAAALAYLAWQFVFSFKWRTPSVPDTTKRGKFIQQVCTDWIVAKQTSGMCVMLLEQFLVAARAAVGHDPSLQVRARYHV